MFNANGVLTDLDISCILEKVQCLNFCWQSAFLTGTFYCILAYFQLGFEDVSILISTSPKWISTMCLVPKFLHWVFQSLEVQPTSPEWHVSAAWQASFTIDWNPFTFSYFVPWGRQTCYQFWDSCPRSRVLLSRMILCPGCIWLKRYMTFGPFPWKQTIYRLMMLARETVFQSPYPPNSNHS